MTEALYTSDLQSLPLIKRGKVRDLYRVDDAHLLIVATDRLSAFDVVLPNPIPGKGKVLTRLTNFWFERTRHIIANHLTDIAPEAVVADSAEREQVAGRAMVVQALKPLPIEAIVRGYLAGSGWKEYRRTGAVCGVRLPEGLREAEMLPRAIFTPSTKAETGDHDENISFERAEELVGGDLARQIRAISLAIYEEAALRAKSRGILVADTKFEFGLDGAGRLILIDELLTPDSSRFWDEEAYRPGVSPPNFDKQYVRDYLEQIRWNKRPPAPDLPEDVVARTAEKYREACTRIVGNAAETP